MEERVFRHAEATLRDVCADEVFEQLPSYARQSLLEQAERRMEDALKAKMLSGAPITAEALTTHNGAVKLLRSWQENGGPYPCIAERFFVELDAPVPAAWRLVAGEQVSLLDDSGREWPVRVALDSGFTWSVRVQTESGYAMDAPRQRVTSGNLKEAVDLVRRQLSPARACGGSVAMITPREHTNLLEVMGKARLLLEKVAGGYVPPGSAVAAVLDELEQTVGYLDRCVDNYTRANGPTQLHFSFGV